jgi:SNF2 family DNA or RNA helicase
VLDESQEVKDYETGKHKAAKEIAQYASRRVIATGTPIANDLTDEWAQLQILDESILGIRYVTTFRRSYCVMGGFENRQVIAHRNIEEFKRRTSPYVFRATKEEIGILPKRYGRWHFDLTAEQLRVMREIRRDLEAELESGAIIEVKNVANKISKFQQCASGFVKDAEGRAHRIVPLDANPRIEAALEWYEWTGSKKAIMWAFYLDEIADLTSRLAREGVPFVVYNGSISDRGRKEALDMFMTPGVNNILVANAKSAGTGLNLQGLCNHALYYTNTFSHIDRVQSEDRIHRIGTKGDCVYTDLVAHGGPETYILRKLAQKKGLSDIVLDSKELRELLASMEV